MSYYPRKRLSKVKSNVMMVHNPYDDMPPIKCKIKPSYFYNLNASRQPSRAIHTNYKPIPFTLSSNETGSTIHPLYQATLANHPSGHFLTYNFLTSSVKSIHIPKHNGKKKYSAGIGLLLIADVNPGM